MGIKDSPPGGPGGAALSFGAWQVRCAKSSRTFFGRAPAARLRVRGDLRPSVEARALRARRPWSPRPIRRRVGTLNTAGSTQKAQTPKQPSQLCFRQRDSRTHPEGLPADAQFHEPSFTQRAGLKVGGPGHDTANGRAVPTAAQPPPLLSGLAKLRRRAPLPLPPWGTRRAACRGGWGVGLTGASKQKNVNSPRPGPNKTPSEASAITRLPEARAGQVPR